MPLVTYREVVPWGPAIKRQIAARRMPIWHAAHGYGAFANDPSLTAAEMAMVVAWVDAGMPEGGRPTARQAAATARFGRNAAVTIPASASQGRGPLPARWITGWRFDPGDPLITSAVITGAGGIKIGTWVAGDAAVVLPPNAAIRVTAPITVVLHRRARTDYEKPFAARPSALRLLTRSAPPRRRAWVEQVGCGAPRTAGAAELLAIRPLLADGGAARVWLERPGAAATILGWFRDYDGRYPRAYWLARGVDLPPESRVQADAACTIELTLASF